MDLDKIEELIRLVDESTVTELEIQEEETTIRISKTGPACYGSEPGTTPAAPRPTARKSRSGKKDPKKLFRSPMVGSFYRSSNEEDAPLVNEGQQVKKGQPLCVIEAMKMLNMVESDRDGVIEEILVDSGQTVEFGQPLFVIRD